MPSSMVVKTNQMVVCTFPSMSVNGCSSVVSFSRSYWCVSAVHQMSTSIYSPAVGLRGLQDEEDNSKSRYFLRVYQCHGESLLFAK